MRILITGGTGFIGRPLCELIGGAAPAVVPPLRSTLYIQCAAIPFSATACIASVRSWNSIAVPSGRLSQPGDNSVRNIAMPKDTGTPMAMAIRDVIRVP